MPDSTGLQAMFMAVYNMGSRWCMVDGSKNVFWLLEQQYMLRRRTWTSVEYGHQDIYTIILSWKLEEAYTYIFFQKDNQMVFHFILAVLRWCVQSIRWKTSLYSPVFVVCTGSWGPWPDDPQMAEHRIHFTLTFVLGRPKHITFFFITDEREIYAPEVPGDRHL